MYQNLNETEALLKLMKECTIILVHPKAGRIGIDSDFTDYIIKAVEEKIEEDKEQIRRSDTKTD